MFKIVSEEWLAKLCLGFVFNFKWNARTLWSKVINCIFQNADLAITDLTINSDRIQALDFTPSFMNLGIALLYRKPIKEPPSTFSFMSPFSMDVWAYLGAAYLTVSLCFFCLGRLSPSQWENKCMPILDFDDF